MGTTLILSQGQNLRELINYLLNMCPTFKHLYVEELNLNIRFGGDKSYPNHSKFLPSYHKTPLLLFKLVGISQISRSVLIFPIQKKYI
jgi:hypothetical protein